jgi:hypothetical protein
VTDTASTEVDRLYEEATEVLRVLGLYAEVSLLNSVGDNLRKALLLAAASHFEHRVCTIVLEFIRERANGSPLVEQFVRNKAIARQYHTWFNWAASNANQFFGLFGEQFRTAMVARLANSEDLTESVKAFLQIGSERNGLIHGDYATFSLEKTLDEIHILYTRACPFVATLPVALRECDDSQRQTGPK